MIYGDGEQTCDFIHVYDVVRALRLAMASDYQGVLDVDIGRAYSFNDVIGMINAELGTDVKRRRTRDHSNPPTSPHGCPFALKSKITSLIAKGMHCKRWKI